MQERFLPEGILIHTSENERALSGIGALEKTMQSQRIAEARAVLCDSEFNLIFDLNGIRGVMPRSQVGVCEDENGIRDIAVLTRVGKAVCFVIDSLEKSEAGTVAYLSRKKAQEKCLREYLDLLEDKDVIRAKVTHFEPFGCFCDIGCGIISLLSIDCISVSRISHPSERFRMGEFIYAAVKGRDEVLLGSKGRISLTHKELLGTWQENADRFCVGQTVAGIVRSVEDYGIFIELAPNLAGLAEKKEGVEVGQTAAVYIKNIIPQKMKVKLVLVDCTSGEKQRIKTEYFITEGNVSHWRYAPDSCVRK